MGLCRAVSSVCPTIPATKPLTRRSGKIELIPVGYSVEIDEAGQDAEQIANRIVEQVKPGDILVFQNNSPNTAPAIEEIISRLKSLGYRFETVSDLLGEEYTVNSSGVAVPSQSPVNS